MPLYEFRCGGCGARAGFPSRFDAGVAGWGSADVVAVGKTRYVVACPRCLPDWMKKIVADGIAGAKKGSTHA